MILLVSSYLIHLGPHLIPEVADELTEVKSLKSVLKSRELGQREGGLDHQEQAEQGQKTSHLGCF